MDLQLAITVVLLASANVGCTRTFLYIKNDERESAEGDRLDTKLAYSSTSSRGHKNVVCWHLRCVANVELYVNFPLRTHVRTFYVCSLVLYSIDYSGMRYR